MDLTPTFHRLLDTPIAEPHAGTEFKTRAKQLGFRTIREIISSNRAWLHAHAEFRYGWYAELLDLLAGKGLVGLMD